MPEQNSYINAEDIDGDIKTGYTANRFGYGLKIGAQWVIKDLITIDWNFGGLGADLYRFSTFDYVYKDDKYVQDKSVDYLWRLAFATNLTVGYAF